MRSPLIRRPGRSRDPRSKERGVTMALIAVAMVSVLAMAALSIDIGTFYEAKAEAQRSADAAALTAARIISISGITGDPGNATNSWSTVCGGGTSTATVAATKVAQQNLIASVSIPTASITVNYTTGSGAGPSADCTTLAGSSFGVNPVVTVKVQRNNLPIFFGRVFSIFGSNFASTNVSATAAAEAFNSSDSGTVAASMIPVKPRCVKPWIVPNVDPGGGSFVSTLDGSITKQGVLQLGAGAIGEAFQLASDCIPGATGCNVVGTSMIANPPASGGGIIHYVPALVSAAAGATSACTPANNFSTAIVGCDQSTVYACGTALGGQADLTENPVNPTGVTGDTGTSVQCLTNSGTGGEDTLNTTPFPFQIEAGLSNPLVKNGIVNDNDIISTSNSIVTVPIYDGAALAGTQPTVSIVGFLQVFIQGGLLPNGNMNVIVLNVVGCSNTAAGNPTVAGTSPVPVRLITPP
jgi:Flp pilus assembly protein TadG